MSALTNEFKSTPPMAVVKGTKFKATDPKVMSKLINRDARPTQKLNPPKFEVALVSCQSKGLLSLFGIRKF